MRNVRDSSASSNPIESTGLFETAVQTSSNLVGLDPHRLSETAYKV